jgi:hypothetical protein
MNKSRRIGILIFALSSLALAADTPRAKPKKRLTLQDLISNAAGPSQKTTSVAGVRGLEETNGHVDTQARDYAAIERLEQVVVHENELKAFMNEGQLK